MNTSQQPIASGRTAEIYAWGQDKVLKLYRPEFSPEMASQEACIHRAVQAAGVPCPRMEKLVEVEGRKGILFERLEGQSLLELLRRNPFRLNEVARLMAELHAEIHSRSAPGLPSQRERFRARIDAVPELSAEEKSALQSRLASLADGEQVCHNDFHPDNILLTGRGPLVIDWMDATSGSPAADVARTALILGFGAPPPGATRWERWFIALFQGRFRRLYLDHYFRLVPQFREEAQAWMPVVAAARLLEKIPGEHHRLRRLVASL